MKKIILLIFVISLTLVSSSQESDSTYPEIFTIGIGPQLNSFFGDIKSQKTSNAFTNSRTAWSLDIEKRVSKLFSIQLEYINGKLSDNYRSINLNENRNFESSFHKIGANVILNFDNYLENKGNFSPYIAVGAGLFSFKTKGDLLDKNGNSYDSASIFYRDYDYETTLSNDSSSYNTSTLTAPISFGFKWKESRYLQGRIYASYDFIFTDWVDNLNLNNNNDHYLSLGFTFNYAIHHKNKVKKEKLNIDWDQFNHTDEDKDGVIDINDKCHHTAKNITVDMFGCPIDSDKDGVPDHIDLEPKSKNILHVDEFGRELTDSLIYDRLHHEDSIEIEKNQMFSDTTENNEMNNNYLKAIKIGDLEVMSEDLGNMNLEDAMKACADLGDGWRLPTKDELNILYENKEKIGGFTEAAMKAGAVNYYWSSTEFTVDMAWNQFFYDGNKSPNYKTNAVYVRAVRAF